MLWSGRHLLAAALIAGVSLSALGQEAGDQPVPEADYQRPSLEALTRTMIRFNGTNTDLDPILDEYARVVHCDLYRRFYTNEFEWQRIRPAMRQSIEINREGFPLRYRYSGRVWLDQYDFEDEEFDLRNADDLRQLGVVWLLNGSEVPCAEDEPGSVSGDQLSYLPQRFRVRLDQPISLQSIPMSPEFGRRLLGRLTAEGNDERVVWMTMDISLTGWLDKTGAGRGGATATFRGEVDRITYYADRGLQTPFYSFDPNEKASRSPYR